ncbi:uncharacterized protein LOC108672181 [Hyalella azteca]|uniref:Uncharacterized protein LOC108672181 n=1 Tax=Hyalella azteca TaxID=294128 RepID=A0A8B7NNM2_HYAAZ|nr:uncharacterized protein LOC108672181 [Hyalella azteca]XP_018015304.1 uncharacterized protein LOC108672181 [Hyalella azteca]
MKSSELRKRHTKAKASDLSLQHTNMSESRASDSVGLRRFLTYALLLLIILTVTFNALAGVGVDPFNHRTGSVSDRFPTCFTPAGYTFSVWSVIYIALILIVIYSISLLFRKVADSDEAVWRLGGAVSPAFLIFYNLNLIANIAWLFAWDRLLLTGSAVGLLLIAFTNIIAQAVACYSYAKAAPVLLERSRRDFWCGLLVVNGYALYCTWTFLASLLNLSIFLIHEVEIDDELVCTVMLSAIPAVMLVYALLEALYFVRSLNALVTPFFIYLWASIGIYMKDREDDSGPLYELKIFNIALAAALCLQRVVVVFLRNRGNAINRLNAAHVSSPKN